MRPRARLLNTVLAGLALAFPATARAGLSTPLLMAHPPRYRELRATWRARTPLVTTGLAAETTLVVRAARGYATTRTALTIVASTAALATAAVATYDPWLFTPRRSRLRVHPADAADQVLGTDTEVVGLRINGEARAYPARLLARPHLLRDVLRGQSIAISCAACWPPERWTLACRARRNCSASSRASKPPPTHDNGCTPTGSSTTPSPKRPW